MRKILYYILLFVLFCFVIPIIFTKKQEIKLVSKETEQNQIQNEQQENKDIAPVLSKSNYDYKQYNTIKLLHAKTGQVEKLPIDEYIYGVVSAEMPASFETEALKAQAIVARTYTIYKIQNNGSKHENADICDEPTCCQAWISKEDRLEKWEADKALDYWNKITNSVDETKGKIITYEGKPINAFFHSNSAGKTETTINVWGGGNYPYLQTVTTSGEESYSQYQSDVTINKQEFINKIKEKHPEFIINFEEQKCIQIIEYTEGGRVKKIRIGNLELSGVEIRTIFSLKSANFTINVLPDNIIFNVLGYGHGVGMSQTGADSLAKQGSSYEQIIKHFYTGVEIQNI